MRGPYRALRHQETVSASTAPRLSPAVMPQN
jgi:hypothetical protein